MNKFILALTLTLLAPFFSSANIFENVNTFPLTEKTLSLYLCMTSGQTKGSVEIDKDADPYQACASVIQSFVSSVPDTYNCGGASSSVIHIYGSLHVRREYGYGHGTCTRVSSYYAIQPSFQKDNTIEECPDDSLIRVDSNQDGEKDSCAALTDIQQNDTCDYNDVYSNPVTEPAVCIAKSDGSQCAASAVDVGGGNQVYMPTENDCYGDVYPILDENGGIGDMPDGSDQQCTESGALSYCPADPSEVCPNGECEAGCGNMNGTFVCIAPLEPPEVPCTGDDCGEGETPTPCTGDDCGEGETPTPCTGDDCGEGTGGGGDKEGFCDKEGNCETGIATKTEPSDGLEGFWKSDYPDGINGIVDGKISDAKNTEFFVFIESFNPTLGNGSAAPMQMCFNLGSMGNFGCQSFKIDPRVYPAIRIFILITAGFLCRKILFGG